MDLDSTPTAKRTVGASTAAIPVNAKSRSFKPAKTTAVAASSIEAAPVTPQRRRGGAAVTLDGEAALGTPLLLDHTGLTPLVEREAARKRGRSTQPSVPGVKKPKASASASSGKDGKAARLKASASASSVQSRSSNSGATLATVERKQRKERSKTPKQPKGPAVRLAVSEAAALLKSVRAPSSPEGLRRLLGDAADLASKLASAANAKISPWPMDARGAPQAGRAYTAARVDVGIKATLGAFRGLFVPFAGSAEGGRDLLTAALLARTPASAALSAFGRFVLASGSAPEHDVLSGKLSAGQLAVQAGKWAELTEAERKVFEDQARDAFLTAQEHLRASIVADGASSASAAFPLTPSHKGAHSDDDSDNDEEEAEAADQEGGAPAPRKHSQQRGVSVSAGLQVRLGLPTGDSDSLHAALLQASVDRVRGGAYEAAALIEPADLRRRTRPQAPFLPRGMRRAEEFAAHMATPADYDPEDASPYVVAAAPSREGAPSPQRKAAYKRRAVVPSKDHASYARHASGSRARRAAAAAEELEEEALGSEEEEEEEEEEEDGLLGALATAASDLFGAGSSDSVPLGGRKRPAGKRILGPSAKTPAPSSALVAERAVVRTPFDTAASQAGARRVSALHHVLPELALRRRIGAYTSPAGGPTFIFAELAGAAVTLSFEPLASSAPSASAAAGTQGGSQYSIPASATLASSSSPASSGGGAGAMGVSCSAEGELAVPGVVRLTLRYGVRVMRGAKLDADAESLRQEAVAAKAKSLARPVPAGAAGAAARKGGPTARAPAAVRADPDHEDGSDGEDASGAKSVASSSTGGKLGRVAAASGPSPARGAAGRKAAAKPAAAAVAGVKRRSDRGKGGDSAAATAGAADGGSQSPEVDAEVARLNSAFKARMRAAGQA